MALNYYFVPIPNAVIEAMLNSRLTGGQLRILLWTLRKTIGWNKVWVSATWYRIAKELGIERSRVRRDAVHLITKGVVIQQGNDVRVETDPARWEAGLRRPEIEAPAPLDRGVPAPVFRRAKDSIKDKEYRQASTRRGGPYHPAGAAKPIPGKYDAL